MIEEGARFLGQLQNKNVGTRGKLGQTKWPSDLFFSVF
jgi:hypothetical protein